METQRHPRTNRCTTAYKRGQRNGGFYCLQQGTSKRDSCDLFALQPPPPRLHGFTHTHIVTSPRVVEGHPEIAIFQPTLAGLETATPSAVRPHRGPTLENRRLHPGPPSRRPCLRLIQQPLFKVIVAAFVHRRDDSKGLRRMVWKDSHRGGFFPHPLWKTAEVPSGHVFSL